MALTYVADVYASDRYAGETLDAGTLDVQAGDVLVASVGWEGDTATTFSIGQVGGGNSFTPKTERNSGGWFFNRCAILTNATAATGATFRLTIDNTETWKSIRIVQLRPDSGETVTDENINAYASGTSTPALSTAFSTTGTDEFVLAFLKHDGGSSPSSPLIAGVAADGSITGGYQYVGYSNFSSPQSSITAQITTSSNPWIIEVVAIKSESGGSSPVPKIMQSMDQFAGGALCVR